MSANPNGIKVPREVRVRQVRELRDQGLLLREIAEQLGIATSTVQAYLADPTGENAKERKRKRSGVCADCGHETFNNGSVPPMRCWPCAKAHSKTLEWRRSHRVPSVKRWSDAEILAAIRRTARNGIANKRYYDEAYDSAPRGSMPSFPLIIRRFDLWANAVKAAGLSLGARNRGGRPYSTRLTRDGALLAVETCADEIGRPPTYREYQEWAGRVGAPCGEIVRQRVGTWQQVTEALLAEELVAA